MTVTLGKGVVHPGAPVGRPESGGDHPLVQTLPRMTERRIGRLRLPGGKAVEGDRQVVDPC